MGRRATWIAVAVVVAAMTVSAPAGATAPTGEGVPGTHIDSVVVLGDSVAAGEGARDGYVYRDRSFLPAWVPPARPARAGDRCGRTDAAYGARVAAALGAELTNLACSGATFGDGVALDRRFEAARPDLVVVTAGANSVDFERAYAFCVLSARGVSEAEAARIVRSSSVRDALVTALDLAAERARGSAPADTEPGCTADNPGAHLRETVLARAAAVGADARALARAIRERGEELGTVPEVVFTTYPDPLPDTAAGILACPDGAGLGRAELAFMHDLFDTVNAELRTALDDVPGVRVADPDPAFAGHRWCDRDPWVYGPSIFVTDPTSRVPFHPTPAGQRAIADAVLAARTGVPAEWRGAV